MENPVYIDHNATTAPRPAVRDAVAGALELTGNASSVHRFGRAARSLIEDARERVAALIGARPRDVVFTSGGTEANALALLGAVPGSGKPRVLVSAVEHVSVLKAVPDAEILPVDADGVVDLPVLDAMLAAGGGDGGPALVSVMLANNETGVIQPLAEVSKIARKHGAMVHCDAVQAAGKIAIDPRALGIDMVSLSAHKIGGPTGVGALVLFGDTDLSALVHGGGQERGRRAGTENIPGIAGFGVAAEAARDGLSDFAALGAWRDGIEEELGRHADVRVFGAGVARLANTSCLTMPGVGAERQIIALDLAGVALSAGSACSSGKVEPSHVLAAMGVPADEAATAIRVSLGWNTTEDEVRRFIEAWNEVYAKSQGNNETKDVAAA